MPHPPLEFVLPDERYRDSFLRGYEELTGREKNDWIYLGPDASDEIIYNRFPDYVATLRERETVAPPHFVRGRTYWAVCDEEVLGRIGLRYELNEFLASHGGHIGYIVRPSARGKGVAKAMLAYDLTTPKAKAIGRLLLTCDDGNLASERTIIANGGVYESTVRQAGKATGKKRFWIVV